jgi:hypothetical protein
MDKAVQVSAKLNIFSHTSICTGNKGKEVNWNRDIFSKLGSSRFFGCSPGGIVKTDVFTAGTKKNDEQNYY